MIFYQLLMALALAPLLAHQALRGGQGAVAERLGCGPTPGPGLRLWLHAASVGEITSARWVIEAVLAARPGLQLLVTTNTTTGPCRGFMRHLRPLTAQGLRRGSWTGGAHKPL